MALSDWSIMAFNKEGAPCDGTLTSHSGIQVAIYKNFIYLRSERIWFEELGWARPTFAQINKGVIDIQDLELTVERCETQAAVFIFARSKIYDEKRNWMAGIGCSSYINDDQVGVSIELADLFFNWLLKTIGVFYAKKSPYKEWLEKIQKDKGAHFNQGDAFFAKSGIIDTVTASSPGSSTESVLSQMLGLVK